MKFIPRSRYFGPDMVRRAVQSALAATATYLLMRSLNLQEAFLAILSAVLIIQPSVGGTMGAAFTRLQATLVGSLISLACVAVLPDVWGTTAGLALSMLVVGGIAGLRPDWSYGAVAAAGIALASEAKVLETAGERGIAIVIGAATGVLVSLLVWPDRAEARFDRHFRSALRATATRLADALEAATEEGHEAAPPEHVSDYHKSLQSAQEALNAVKLVDRANMQRRLEALRRLYNSVIILDRTAEADVVPASGRADLIDQVSALRRDTCSVLNALADREKNPEERTRQIDEVLQGLQAMLAEGDPTSDLHRNRNALAFGLHEVRRSIGGLIEALRS
ncbi:FUSC family protein [Paracoccus sp. (in: a-proteobacteria)]|uniref:FUSC family protein n=1 Tax=Paracoccus sp. TaxID=267 RepID=UPI00396CE022